MTLNTAPHFAPLHRALIRLLRELAPDDWDRPTIAGQWRVRDVAAHLLDGDLRKLAAHRDGQQLAVERPPSSYQEVVALIQHLNAGGVAFGARLSPRLLTDLLDVTGRWTCDFIEGLDPEGVALFPVAWAGETESTNRFDTAREFTERWHHQMQIRMAVGASGQPAYLLAPQFFEPLFATSVQAVPHAYRDVAAPDGVSIVLEVTGEPILTNTLIRERAAWHLHAGAVASPTTRVQASSDSWWRLFFNALPLPAVSDAFTVKGPAELVTPLWRARAVMV